VAALPAPASRAAAVATPAAAPVPEQGPQERPAALSVAATATVVMMTVH
jgi:hypothetical protein